MGFSYSPPFKTLKVFCYSISQVAKLLRVSEPTARRLISTGALDAVRFHPFPGSKGMIRVTPIALRNFLRAHAIGRDKK